MGSRRLYAKGKIVSRSLVTSLPRRVARQNGLKTASNQVQRLVLRVTVLLADLPDQHAMLTEARQAIDLVPTQEERFVESALPRLDVAPPGLVASTS